MTCLRLTACTAGSAPGPTLGNEHGRPLPFYIACSFSHVAIFCSVTSSVSCLLNVSIGLHTASEQNTDIIILSKNYQIVVLFETTCMPTNLSLFVSWSTTDRLLSVCDTSSASCDISAVFATSTSGLK